MGFFTQSIPMVTSCKTVAQNPNWDADIDAVKARVFAADKGPSCRPCTQHLPPHSPTSPWTQAVPNPLSSSADWGLHSVRQRYTTRNHLEMAFLFHSAYSSGHSSKFLNVFIVCNIFLFFCWMVLSKLFVFTSVKFCTVFPYLFNGCQVYQGINLLISDIGDLYLLSFSLVYFATGL